MNDTVLVAGSHGPTGQHVTRLLAERDAEPRAMIRDESQADEMESLGGEPVVADLTEPDSLESAVEGCGAIVFAAGSNGEDVYGVDRDGAINLIDAAEAEGVDRFVMLSSMGADDPESGPDALRDYLIAKAEADEYLRQSDLSSTIVRPGELTTEDGSGELRAADSLEMASGDIPREDVARVLVTAIDFEPVSGKTFEILSGDESIEDALEAAGTNG
ncbi:SDR family oxidoreductase [Halopiger xanaduensis]|uniref:NAD-dependent epimerase/dehydratase n=1 Tax=Halopiger xanaduensis (strain DSM 18323 / JCM 14033 / SH-6) TaxID=797210 RepID=F8DCT2_HALXS|nr:SDR family oxidoreductase [Halopiger xanaduensis]AEH37257.1 NAD-dependent epimerase/dehydratase [Halopiger xanaduensis SH-6]